VVWDGAAVIAHDLPVFPIDAFADRILCARAGRRPVPHLRASVRDYLRIPALDSGLTLLMLLPGIIGLGASTYLAATGSTQQLSLGRWPLLTTPMSECHRPFVACRAC